MATLAGFRENDIFIYSFILLTAFICPTIIADRIQKSETDSTHVATNLMSHM